jgi:hypothetical protein
MTQDPVGDKWEKRANFWYRIWSVFASVQMLLLGLFVVMVAVCCGWAAWDMSTSD